MPKRGGTRANLTKKPEFQSPECFTDKVSIKHGPGMKIPSTTGVWPGYSLPKIEVALPMPDVKPIKKTENLDILKCSDSEAHHILREFDSGAHRDSANEKLRMSLIPSVELDRVAKHYLNGGIKYGFNNWKKGMPLSVYFDSADRHIKKWWQGKTDEDHLAAAIWNLLGAMWTQTNLPAMDDRKDFK